MARVTIEAPRAIQAWERQPGESEEAFEAFTVYLDLGRERSHAKTCEELGKSSALISRWSGHWKWVARCEAWDRAQARELNRKLFVGQAEMRQRIVVLAQSAQEKAARRIANMTDQEVNTMTPATAAYIMRMSIEMEVRARSIDKSDLDEVDMYDAPTIQINFTPAVPEGMVIVRMETGEAGYIPRERIEEFQRDYPEAQVMQ